MDWKEQLKDIMPDLLNLLSEYTFNVEKLYNLKYKLNIYSKMLSFGTNLLRKGLFLSKTYSIAKFMDKNDNWGKIKQDEYKSYFQIH